MTTVALRFVGTIWLLLSVSLVVVQAETSYVVLSPIILTEIMLHPLDATNSSTQWFELYNPDDRPQTLRYGEWNLCHSKGDSMQGMEDCDYLAMELENEYQGIVVAAKDYIVFGNNNDTTTNGNVKIDVLFNFRPFPKDGSGLNSISFYSDRRRRGLTDESFFDECFEGDRIHWSTDTPDDLYRNFSFIPGASLAKINATEFASDPHSAYDRQQIVSNWRPSSTPIHACHGGTCDKGTPGRNNTVTQRVVSPKLLLLLVRLVLVVSLRFSRPRPVAV